MAHYIIAAVLLFASLSTRLSAHTDAVHTIVKHQTLSSVAKDSDHYSNPHYWPGILLTTNLLTANKELDLTYIKHPRTVEVGSRIWVPSEDEAKRVSGLYRKYLNSVRDMSLREPWEVTDSLVSFSQDAKRCTVATWTSAKTAAEHYPSGENAVAGGDIWVTVVPRLREFCRRLDGSVDLTLRLEQRLGIPPLNGKSVFVELAVSTDDIFRPCPDPAISTTTCKLVAPLAVAYSDSITYPNWFYKQYYDSYATAQPSPYPWTSLGYTYDWGGNSEIGESEFIVKKRAPIHVLSVTSTEEYCGR